MTMTGKTRYNALLNFIIICTQSEVVTYGSLPFSISLIWNKKMRFPLWGSFFSKVISEMVMEYSQRREKERACATPIFRDKEQPSS